MTLTVENIFEFRFFPQFVQRERAGGVDLEFLIPCVFDGGSEKFFGDALAAKFRVHFRMVDDESGITGGYVSHLGDAFTFLVSY